jgi:hypothetical protein
MGSVHTHAHADDIVIADHPPADDNATDHPPADDNAAHDQPAADDNATHDHPADDNAAHDELTERLRIPYRPYRDRGPRACPKLSLSQAEQTSAW